MKYTPEEKIAALALLSANGGNLLKTESETGIPRLTLRKWMVSPLNNHPTVSTVRAQLQGSYVAKLSQAREALLERMHEVAQTERDLLKLTTAFKTVSDCAGEAEVNDAVAEAIRARVEHTQAGLN